MKNSSSLAINCEALVPSRTVQITLYSTVGVISFLSNTLLFLVLGFTKKLHTKTNFLLASLGITDWFIFVFGITINISNLATTPIDSGLSCDVTGLLVLIPFLVSNFNLSLIAFHRYMLIVRNRIHKRIFSFKKVVIYVIGIWCAGIIISIPPLFGWGRFSYNPHRAHCMIDWGASKSYLLFVQIVAFPVPLTIMVFSYYKVFTHSYTSQKRLRSSSDRHNLKINTRELSLTLTLLVVVVVFFSSQVPYAVLIYIEGFFKAKPPPVFSFLAMFFAYSNGMCDFWIYAAMSVKFRHASFNIIRNCLFVKKNSRILPTRSVSSSNDPNLDDPMDELSTHSKLNKTPQVSARRRSVIMNPAGSFYKSVRPESRNSVHDIFQVNHPMVQPVKPRSRSQIKSELSSKEQPSFVITEHQ